MVTVNVDDPPPFRNAGLNDGVAPSGKPITLRDTVSLKPPLGVTVTLYDPVRPRFTTEVPGVAARVKSGDAAEFTTSVTEVDCVRPPAESVAVIVSGYEPGGVDALVVTVRVLEPLPLE